MSFMDVRNTEVLPEDRLKKENVTNIDATLKGHSQILVSVRRELLKLHPDVLTETRVNGGSTINDVTPRRILFELGGKPSTVYHITLWNRSAIPIAASMVSMASSADGFLIPTTPISLVGPLSELYIALSSAGQVIVNGPSNLATDGGVYIYGFTIPDYEI